MEKHGMKSVFFDFWLKLKNDPEFGSLDESNRRLLGNRLIPEIKRYMSDDMEDDFKK